MRVMVQRSPFLTQSVAVSRSRRSLLRVMITSPTLAWFPSSQVHLSSGRDVAEAMITGSSVEVGDKLPGRGQHDRVQSGSLVRNPSSESILGGFGNVADVNPAVSEVEVERRRVAFAECERCGRFGRVGEAMQLGQAEGAVGVCDVTKHTAGADRGELLIITDEAHDRTTIEGELDGGVEGQGVGHTGFVDDQQRRRANRGRPVRKVAVL
jgi:hypothetical protein